MYSPAGRVFQVEYAAKAVEASGFVSCGAIIDAYIMVP